MPWPLVDEASPIGVQTEDIGMPVSGYSRYDHPARLRNCSYRPVVGCNKENLTAVRLVVAGYIVVPGS